MEGNPGLRVRNGIKWSVTLTGSIADVHDKDDWTGRRYSTLDPACIDLSVSGLSMF
jgi:hypothetical protein